MRRWTAQPTDPRGRPINHALDYGTWQSLIRPAAEAIRRCSDLVYTARQRRWLCWFAIVLAVLLSPRNGE